jgi:hypothetical protein
VFGQVIQSHLRQWLSVALREFIVGQDFAVPAKAVALLQLLTKGLRL